MTTAFAMFAKMGEVSEMVRRGEGGDKPVFSSFRLVKKLLWKTYN